MERGVRRMLGRTYEEVSPGQWGWRPTGQSEETARSREIAFAIADGDLFAGDDETAKWATSVTGKPVKFDPTFGGAVPAATSDAKEKTR
jgi:hypothetical protein